MPTKSKTIKCELYRCGASPWASLTVADDGADIWDDWAVLRYVAPALTKGLRPGHARKLILTQTATGFKLERAKK